MSNLEIIGPIQVSHNGRYFVDHKNNPFFWLGDTQWELFRCFSFEEAELILRNRKAKGFTVIQVMLTGVGDGTKPNFAGYMPWINNDPSTPNEEYFKNVDTVLQLGNKIGLIFVLGVYHQMQVSYITPENAREYARWIANRYKDMPNIIWTTYPKAQQNFIPVTLETAAGLQEGDNGKHLICLHPDPSPASSSFIHNESWLAFNMIQTWAYYDLIYKMVTNDYNLTPTKPVIMAEGAYEEGTEYGFPVTPLMVRKQAYWSYMAGGHHGYGHNDNWRVPKTWKASLDAPGAFQMGILKKVFTELPWWDLVPDQSIFADDKSVNNNFNTALLSNASDMALIYLRDPTTVSINMGKIISAKKTTALWIDPRSGEQMDMRISQKEVTTFTTPDGWEDAVLLIK